MCHLTTYNIWTVKSKDHQSHIKYTQRQIFTRKPIKGENLFFFEMIGSLLQFCTSFTIEHQLNVSLLPLFHKLQLVESTNSLFSLAPTRRKHQLPGYSSTNWMEAPTSWMFQHQLMEAPTSSYTGSNLHNREHLFSLAPPCHPSFSGCNQMEAATSCVQAPT
jgi:hypothetical protein